MSRSTLEIESNGGEQIGDHQAPRVIAASTKPDHNATTLLQVVSVKILGRQGRTMWSMPCLTPDPKHPFAAKLFFVSCR